jgi:chromate transporter
VTCFTAVALLRWPLVWVLLILGAIACVYAFKRVPPRAMPDAER